MSHIRLLHRYYVSAPSVTTIGKPSASLTQELEKVEKARIAKQKEDLGEEGLKKLQKELDSAKKESEKPIPPELLTSFPVTNVSCVGWDCNTDFSARGPHLGSCRDCDQPDSWGQGQVGQRRCPASH